MNYLDLKEYLDYLPTERLLDDVTVCANGEYFAVGLVVAEDGDVLDKGHLFLVPLVDYTLITYDVSGNSQDGWEINDKYESSNPMRLPAESHLSSDVLSRYFQYNCVLSENSCCDDGVIYVTTPEGKPLFELIAEEDEE